MSDDSDLMIAAAASAAVFMWMGVRSRERRRDTAGGANWRVLLHHAAAGVMRCWRETPGYLLITAIRDAFFRKH